MKPGMSFEWDSRPDATEHLAEDLFAAVGRRLPDLTDGEVRTRTVGAVAARRAGALLGWAWVFEDRDGERAARVQELYVPREARRLETGHYDLRRPAAEEFTMVTGMYSRAAEEARAAGYRALRWDGRDAGPAGQAATALNAHGHREFARYWSVEPAAWQRPTGLPDVHVQQLPGPGLVLAAADAEVSAFIDGHAAYINVGESISHNNTEPRRLAALIAELVARLRRDQSEVTDLTVWEFGDAAVRQALPLAGLRITARSMEYELVLTPS